MSIPWHYLGTLNQGCGVVPFCTTSGLWDVSVCATNPLLDLPTKKPTIQMYTEAKGMFDIPVPDHPYTRVLTGCEK